MLGDDGRDVGRRGRGDCCGGTVRSQVACVRKPLNTNRHLPSSPSHTQASLSHYPSLTPTPAQACLSRKPLNTTVTCCSERCEVMAVPREVPREAFFEMIGLSLDPPSLTRRLAYPTNFLLPSPLHPCAGLLIPEAAQHNCDLLL